MFLMSFLSYDVNLQLTTVILMVIIHSKHFSVCYWLQYPRQLELKQRKSS